MVTQIFLDLQTTDIPCDLIRLHKPSEVFNTLTFPRSECPADMSAISEDSIMCSHITHHYTFKYSIQATHMLQHIQRTFAGMHTNILSHFRSMLSLNIRYYSHTPHRPFIGSSRTFGYSPFHFLSTPDALVHISEDFYCAKLCTGTHSGIYPFPSIRPLCLQPFEV